MGAGLSYRIQRSVNMRPRLEAVWAARTDGLVKNRDTVLHEKRGIESKLKDYVKKYEGLEKTVNELNAYRLGHDDFVQKYLQKALLADVAISADESGLNRAAIEDATSAALKVFKYDEDKGFVHPEGLTMKDFMVALRGAKPHYFLSSSGRADAGGSNYGGGEGYTLTKEQSSDPAAYRRAKANAQKPERKLFSSIIKLTRASLAARSAPSGRSESPDRPNPQSLIPKARTRRALSFDSRPIVFRASVAFFGTPETPSNINAVLMIRDLTVPL
jgi:hypothetical protein